MQLFTHIREDTCIYCKRDRAIEIYDKNNNPIRFSFILDTGKLFLLNIRQLCYGKCKYCNKRFVLDWTNIDAGRRIPKPLSDNKLKLYIQQYSKSKIV